MTPAEPAQPRADLASDLALRLAGSTDADVDAVINEALGRLARDARADRAYVTVFHVDGTFDNSHEWTAAGVVPHQPAIQRLQASRFPYSNRVAREGRVLYVRDLADLPPEGEPERESFSAFGVRSVLQVPILVNGEMLGLVGFNHMSGVGEWSDATIEQVALVGRGIGIALSRRAAEERIRGALVAAERASRAKDDLIARASHELRTPLHAVVGFAEILELDGVAHDALGQIQANGRLLLSMIDDLLELGRLGSVPTSADDAASIHDLLLDILADLTRVAATKGVTLSLGPQPASDPTTATATRVRQLLHCLVSPALVAAGPNGFVRAWVDDHGGQAATEIVVRYEGPNHGPTAGLGLALANSFVDDLGGQLTSTDDGHGVTFAVRLG